MISIKSVLLSKAIIINGNRITGDCALTLVAPVIAIHITLQRAVRCCCGNLAGMTGGRIWMSIRSMIEYWNIAS